MAQLFRITVSKPPVEPETRVVNVVAETPEEAQAKAQTVVAEGEMVTTVENIGEVQV